MFYEEVVCLDILSRIGCVCFHIGLHQSGLFIESWDGFKNHIFVRGFLEIIVSRTVFLKLFSAIVFQCSGSLHGDVVRIACKVLVTHQDAGIIIIAQIGNIPVIEESPVTIAQSLFLHTEGKSGCCTAADIGNHLGGTVHFIVEVHGCRPHVIRDATIFGSTAVITHLYVCHTIVCQRQRSLHVADSSSGIEVGVACRLFSAQLFAPFGGIFVWPARTVESIERHLIETVSELIILGSQGHMGVVVLRIKLCSMTGLETR